MFTSICTHDCAQCGGLAHIEGRRAHIKSPKTEVTGNCEPPRGCRELNIGSL